jgi:hypothetical protein
MAAMTDPSLLKAIDLEPVLNLIALTTHSIL